LGVYEFLARVGIYAEMDYAERTSSNLSFENIVIYPSHPIIFLELGIECLLMVNL